MIYDPLVNCPYDESHRILKSRLAFHLTRCAKNHTTANKKKCPYDVRHIIDAHDYEAHVATCPMREGVMHYALHDEQAFQEMKVVPVPTPDTLPPTPSCNENWDDDPEVISYNPLRNIEDKPVVRILIGGSKSEKRRFREQERRRMQELENRNERQEKEKQAAANQKSSKSKSKILEKLEKAETLRKPMTKSLDKSKVDEAQSAVAQSVETTSADLPVTSDATKRPDDVARKITSDTGAIPKSRPAAVDKLDATPPVKQNAETETKAPMNYAALLKNKTSDKNEASFDQSLNNSRNVFEDSEKENTTVNNSSFLSCDTSLVEKVTQDVHNITLDDEGYQLVKSKLDKKYKSAKNKSTEKNATADTKVNNNREKTIYSKKPKVAANFFSQK